MDKYFEALEKSKGSTAFGIISQIGFDETADVLEKGKRAQMGEIRIWNGVKYQKTPGGWVPVKGEGKGLQAEPKKGKSESNKEGGSLFSGKISDENLNLLKESGFVQEGDKYVKDYGEGWSFQLREVTPEEREKAYELKFATKKDKEQNSKRSLFIGEVVGPEGSVLNKFGDNGMYNDYVFVHGDEGRQIPATRVSYSFKKFFESERNSPDVKIKEAKEEQTDRKEREKWHKEFREELDNDPYSGENNKHYSYKGGEKQTASEVFYDLWKALQRKLYKVDPGIAGSGQGGFTYIGKLKNEAEGWFKEHYQEKKDWSLEDFNWLIEEVKL